MKKKNVKSSAKPAKKKISAGLAAYNAARKAAAEKTLSKNVKSSVKPAKKKISAGLAAYNAARKAAASKSLTKNVKSSAKPVKPAKKPKVIRPKKDTRETHTVVRLVKSPGHDETQQGGSRRRYSPAIYI